MNRCFYSVILLGVSAMLWLLPPLSLTFAENAVLIEDPIVVEPPKDPMSVQEILAEIQTLIPEEKAVVKGIQENLKLKRKLLEESETLRGEKKNAEAAIESHRMDCTREYDESTQLGEYLRKKKECDEAKPALVQKKREVNEKLKANGDKELARIKQAKELTRQYQMIQAKKRMYNQMLEVKSVTDAQKACLKKPTVEEMHCCMSVIWDKKNPKDCEKALGKQFPPELNK